MANHTIEVINLTRFYHYFPAVDQISFYVDEGSIFGLLGPNGAGKSTTIKMLTTLLPVTSGTARVAGYDIIAQPAKVRGVIGYVPQLISADGELTGYENLLLSSKLYALERKIREKRIHEVLEFMGLLDVSDQMVNQYSGGMIRRLEIAQALLHQPKVLFLDEPSVGLDPAARKSLWTHIQEWRSQFGTTILMTTHDMEEADKLCDIVAFMHLGHIVAMETPKNLKASLGPKATLDDVFILHTGSSIKETGDFVNVKQIRNKYPIFKRCLQHIEQIFGIVEADLRKLRHDPWELVTRMIQPAIWLLIFGQAMAKTKAIPTGTLSYLDFIAPGILAQSILFIAIFYGIALIWERDMGVLHKILVSPAPRAALVIGRAIAAGLRGLSQILIIYLLSLFLGIHLRWDLLAFAGVLATVMLGGAVFSTFSLIVASLVKKRERFMGIGQVLTMPLFFASNALYPLEMMPHWLKILSILNPLTYQVDALRSFMITAHADALELTIDFGVGLFAFALLVMIATKIYPKILY